jgi:hypothetical protein
LRRVMIAALVLCCGLICMACEQDSEDESKFRASFSTEKYFVIGPGETLFYPFDADKEGIFTLTFPLEVTAIDWSVSGRESALMNFHLDGRYIADAVAVGTPFGLQVRAILGEVTIGSHELRISYNKALSPAKEGLLAIERNGIKLEIVNENDSDYRMINYAPLVYGRGYYDVRDEPVNTFSDAPVVMLCDIYDSGGYTYMEYFLGTTNVDSGSGIYPRVKMAQEGSLSDVARLMEVQFEASGQLVAQRIWQNNSYSAFNGEYIDTHPILKLTGDDNSVSDNFVLEDYDEPRFFPLPVTVNPLLESDATMLERTVHGINWMTGVEIEREGKIVYTEFGDPLVGSTDGTLIADPGNYIYFELFTAGSMVQPSLAVEIILESNEIYQSDYFSLGGEAEYLLGTGGMGRTVVELPVDIGPLDIGQIRIVYRPRTQFSGGRWRVYEVDAFILHDQYFPGPVFASWRGNEELKDDKPSFSFDVDLVLGDDY